MTRACLLTVIAVAGSSVGADEKPEKAVSGTWVVEKAEMDGADITPAMKAYVLTVDGEKYALDDNGRVDRGTLKVDAIKTPKEMDLTGGPTSPLKGKTIRCIYEVKDGKLTICYGMDFKTRPTEFKTAPDGKRMLAVYVPKK